MIDATAASVGGAHTGGASLGDSCEGHWPTYNWTDPQSWCCDAWCYVNPTTCTAEVAKA